MTRAIRDATPGDHEAFTHLFAQLGVPDDPVPNAEQWAKMSTSALFAEESGRVVGYTFVQVLDGIGYVFHIVVDEPARGLGFGRDLLRAAADRFRAAGCARWCLNVRRDNAPAIHLYERFGMRIVHESTQFRIPWERVAALPHEESATVARLLDPADDSAVERVFDLPPGRFAAFRKRPGSVTLRVDASDGGLAAAAFDPAFPGAFPFRATRPTLARPMLDAMRAHARPEHDFVRVVVEADAHLAATLLAAGAQPTLEMFHMRGDLVDAAV